MSRNPWGPVVKDDNQTCPRVLPAKSATPLVIWIQYVVPIASGSFGVTVTTLPETEKLDGTESLLLNGVSNMVNAFTVAGSISSLKVTDMTLSTGVLIVSVSGSKLTIVGGVISWYSYAPISHWLPCGRVTPRWSVDGQFAAPPASIRELPGNRAIVCVGPPLSASWASPKSANVPIPIILLVMVTEPGG